MNLYEKYNLLEQGPPPGANPMAAMMGMMGGGNPQGPPPTVEDQLFERVRSYPKIDVFIQQLQQKGVADSRILDEIYNKFEPEFVYFAKEIIQAANKPKPPAGPGGPGGMPGMPGMPSGGMPGMPSGAGPVSEQFKFLSPDLVREIPFYMSKQRALKAARGARKAVGDSYGGAGGGAGVGGGNTNTLPKIPRLGRDNIRQIRRRAKEDAARRRNNRGG